jgi:ABC-type multidrug transport system fused ATPase/permease subunit
VAVWLARTAGLRGANGSALCPSFAVGSRIFRTWCWIRAHPSGPATTIVPSAETQALAGVDFSVPAGTLLGLLGPNGAGQPGTGH